MKIKEVIAPRPVQVQPSVVSQQARVAKVVNQRAASDQQQPPSEMDKVMAIRQMSAMKKQSDKQYAQRLRQQLASAEVILKQR